MTLTTLPNRTSSWFGVPVLRSLFDDLVGEAGTARLANRLPEALSRDFVPPLNVAETEKSIVVTLETPGMDEKDLDIQVMGNQLTVSGEKKFEEESKDKEFHRVECLFGKFSRSVTLPSALRTDEVDAVYGKGVLTITIHKVEPTPTAKVKIRSQ